MKRFISRRVAESQSTLGVLRLLSILFSLCASASLRFDPVQAQESKPRDGEVRAAWIHTYGPFDWNAEMKKLADAGFNTVFVRVARGANAIYPSRILPRDDWAEPMSSDEMEKAIMAAHNNGLEFHAWKVCWHVGGASKQKGSAKVFYDQLAAEDRLVRDLDGKQAPFLNPADPRNQELELQVAREIVEKYDVDGYHLDYIRYPEEPHYDFDYGQISRRDYEKHLGRKIDDWPRAVHSGDLKWYYENWERENINGLVQRVHAQTKKLKPKVLLSAAVWRAHRHNRATIKQDWIHWANKGWLDFVVPMNYATDDAQFRSDVRAQVANAAGKVLLVAGIGNYKHEKPEETLRQIEIARAEGASGYALFDYKPARYEALLQSLKQGPNSKPTPPAFRAPLAQWQLSPAVSRKDDSSVLQIGKTAVITAKISPDEKQTKAAALLSLAELRGMDAPGKIIVRDERGRSAMAASSEVVWRFPVPPGRWQFVARGASTLPNSKTRHWFDVRGPVFEGQNAAQLTELRAREQPASFDKAKTAVAIYAGGMADSGIETALKNVDGVDAQKFHVLQPQFWQSAKVLFLPQLRDTADLTPAIVTALREWVAAGGTLILTHDAVGFRWHLRMFPEIGQGTALSKNTGVTVLPNDFGITPENWTHEFPDHVVITLGTDGKVLAHETGDETKPVLVAGKLGNGRVFLYGGLLGYAPDGTLDEGERNLIMEMFR